MMEILLAVENITKKSPIGVPYLFWTGREKPEVCHVRIKLFVWSAVGS